MRIKAKTNIGSRDCDITPLPMEGDEFEVSDALGQRFVSLGIAIEIEQPKPAPVVRAVPDEPAIAESKAAEIAPAKSVQKQRNKKE